MARRLYSLLNTSASAMGSGSKCAPISADCPAADAGVLRERAAFWSPVLFVACPDSNHRGKKFLISRNWNTRVVVCVCVCVAGGRDSEITSAAPRCSELAVDLDHGSKPVHDVHGLSIFTGDDALVWGPRHPPDQPRKAPAY
jgi:hypothetical protein